MGRGIDFNFRLPNGDIGSAGGTYVGVDAVRGYSTENGKPVAKAGLIEIAGHATIPDGIYSIESANATPVKARISRQTLKRAGIKKQPSTRKATAEELTSKNIPNLNDLLATRVDAPSGWTKQDDNSFISDDDYKSVGATILSSADKLWAEAELILKVKEPVSAEYNQMRAGQVLFTYLHLAASRDCTDALIKSGITAIAYETVELNSNLPLLAPMSEVAGRMAPQVGAAALQASAGGRGVLLGGVPGVRPGKVLILGGGTAGLAAATIALGMRADVTVVDLNQSRLAYIDQIFNGAVKTLVSNTHEIEQEALLSDLIIGAVLVHGAKAPKLISNELVSHLKKGSVLVDIAIDQGG
ncbi:MAG: hypothetical protein EBT44_06265, partial [Actinobacteria bacterium]|nr:hypothetical protein [Candidatus Fonsibacter lacus]